MRTLFTIKLFSFFKIKEEGLTIVPLVFICLFSSSLSFAHDFTLDKKWLNLHRYKENGNQFKSLVTNPNWFISSTGITSPQEEALAAIKEFNRNPQIQCKFPARVRYLTQLGLIKPLTVICPSLDYMKRKLKLHKVHLIFASYHVNNPSSAFGHTLFKLEGSDQDNDYLNWGLNFSAIQTTKNPLLYGIYGLTGHFKGKFSLLPYFMKLKEYRDHENRDLWEYQLNLNKEQLLYFVEHLWEMNTAEFDYYYLTQNCSYHLLAFLDAINPEWRLADDLDYFVIPSETLKTISKRDQLLKKITYKASPFKKLKMEFLKIDSPENTIIKQIVKERKATDLSLEKLSTKGLDFLIDHIDYSSLKSGSKEQLLFKRRVQLTRSKRKQEFLNSELTSPHPPHSIHPSSYIKLGRKKNLFNKELTTIEYRASFDEYQDLHQAPDKWSQLVLGKMAFSYNEREEDFRLDHFTLLNVEANDQSIFSPLGKSWSIKVAAEDRDVSPRFDLGPSLRTSYGINYQLKKTLLRLTLPLSFHYSKKPKNTFNKNKFSFDSQLTAEVLYRLNQKSSLVLSSALWFNTLLEHRLRFISTFDYRWHFSSQWALAFSGKYRLNKLESGAFLMRYF